LMNKEKVGRAGARKRRTPLLAAMVAVVSLMLLGVASSVAVAAPKGIFAKFAQCPVSYPGNALCAYTEVTSGEIMVGQATIPIDQTIVLQGGALPTGNINEYFELPAANGESVSPTKIEVPGGLQAILGCPQARGRYWASWHNIFCLGHDRWLNNVTAKMEPVASLSDPAILNLAKLIFQEGAGLVLPMRIHLENPLLGEACYLGSEAHPIVLNLTDGTTGPPPPNQSITGKPGEIREEVEDGHGELVITNNTLVDNAFSVPPAEGCGGPRYSSIIDPIINHAIGLESPAGHNTVILNGNQWLSAEDAVLASEAFPTTETPETPPHHHHHGGNGWWPTH
jgi:hypothetical protein